MTKHPRVYLDHILDCIAHIRSYTQGLSKENFLKNDQVQDAVIRRIEIIGEAASKLPADFKAHYPSVPWRQIIGTRNVLIHDYYGVNLNLAWEIVEKDLSDLESKVKSIIAGVK